MSETFTQADLRSLHYERQCAEILRQKGYEVSPVPLENHEKGVDLIAVKYGIHYAVLCRHLTDGQVTADTVKKALSGWKAAKCDAAIVMTDGTFDDAAAELAKVRDVLLWPEQKVDLKDPDSGRYQRFTSVSGDRYDFSSVPKRRRNPSLRRSLIWLIILVIALAILAVVFFRVPALREQDVRQTIDSSIDARRNWT